VIIDLGLGLFSSKGVFSVGITGCTDIAYTAITTASRAEFAAIKYNLQVKTVPMLTMEQLLQVIKLEADVKKLLQQMQLV
jgi:hypothetical protein